MIRFRPTLFLDDKPASSGGSPPPQDQPSRAARVDTLTTRLIARAGGSAEAALAQLATTNITLEDENVELRRDLGATRAKLPADGSVVLPPERAKAFNAFEALKLKPEDVIAALKRRDELEATVADRDRRDLASKGAPAIGFDPEATAELIKRNGLFVELRKVEREVERNGKKEKETVEVPYVRPLAEEKASLVPLTEFAAKLPAFDQRALKAAPPQGDKSTTTTQPTGTIYPEQGATRQGEGPNPALQLVQNLNQKYLTPSQLREKAKTTQEPAHA